MSIKNIDNNGRYPEILAPAGSMESLYAAVNAGCDAVYMGGSMFGARAYADNPDSDNLLYAIDYCHLHGVKLYLTVNTLLKEEELMDRLYNYILPYYKAGLDAAIVQDTGVIYMLHQWFPGLALHASTQMTLVTGIGADMLKDYGITRIVPARELSLSELQQMRHDTDAEIEVFVHGALCYCYSGQCLFSSLLGGRSGNRGRCAQPCRLPYSTVLNGKKQDSYILSMKELSTLPYLDKLIETGADSFKIEGRMKKPSYTALVTSENTQIFIWIMAVKGMQDILKSIRQNSRTIWDSLQKYITGKALLMVILMERYIKETRKAVCFLQKGQSMEVYILARYLAQEKAYLNTGWIKT